MAQIFHDIMTSEAADEQGEASYDTYVLTSTKEIQCQSHSIEVIESLHGVK